jgi:hypothetical protein
LVIYRDQTAFDRLKGLGSFRFNIERRPFSPRDLQWLHEKKHAQTSEIGLDYMLEELGEPLTEVEQERLNRKKDELVTKVIEKSEPPKITTQEFEVKAEPWQGNHRSYLERTTYWGPFRIEQSTMQQHLAKIVPVPGLSDVKVYREPAPLAIMYRRSRALATTKSFKQLHDENRISAATRPAVRLRPTYAYRRLKTIFKKEA